MRTTAEFPVPAVPSLTPLCHPHAGAGHLLHEGSLPRCPRSFSQAGPRRPRLSVPRGTTRTTILWKPNPGGTSGRKQRSASGTPPAPETTLALGPSRRGGRRRPPPFRRAAPFWAEAGGSRSRRTGGEWRPRETGGEENVCPPLPLLKGTGRDGTEGGGEGGVRHSPAPPACDHPGKGTGTPPPPGAPPPRPRPALLRRRRRRSFPGPAQAPGSRRGRPVPADGACPLPPAAPASARRSSPSPGLGPGRARGRCQRRSGRAGLMWRPPAPGSPLSVAARAGPGAGKGRCGPALPRRRAALGWRRAGQGRPGVAGPGQGLHPASSRVFARGAGGGPAWAAAGRRLRHLSWCVASYPSFLSLGF